MKKTEIRFSGFGGQGVIMSAAITGKAAAIFDNKFSTMIQSFGPEARGSSCSATVAVAEEMIDYPYVKNPDVVVAMSQEAYTKFSRDLKKDGILIVEEDLVQIDTPPANVRLFRVPATRFAEEIGKKLVTNIVMVGFFTAVSGVISYEAMKKAVLDSIPKGTEDLNMKAFEKGFTYGMELVREKAEALPG